MARVLPGPSFAACLALILVSAALASLPAASAPAPGTAPRPLPHHPGNIHVAGEAVRVRLPGVSNNTPVRWRLLDERQREHRSGTWPPGASSATPTPEATATTTTSSPAPPPDLDLILDLGPLDIGWYRLETIPADPATTNAPFTTLAVLHPLAEPPPADTPVAVDAAIAWFARSDPARQKDLAQLAALAGVRMVRDRLRWRDLQPQPGALVTDPTTYDTAATTQHEAGLDVLQVFHDTPPWARTRPEDGGRFAPDLRTVHAFAREAALRFRGRVGAWEPWNEANVETFGGHTVDQMCSWQKAAYLGFKAGDAGLVVGWNPTTTVPTPAHTEGLLANETWPYFDTYNIHSYDWAHGYQTLWEPARRAAAGRPLWITEADRGTPHLGNAPWFDQDPRLEALKAEWIPQAYAASLSAGARRHFHFVLGAYHEPNGVQFGLLRHDLTPRPAYAALAATGRCLAGAQALGRWRPPGLAHAHAQLHAFRARPDGIERDVLVAWAEQDVDWDARGRTTAEVTLPPTLTPVAVVDHLGRPRPDGFPKPLTSAPIFVLLPLGQTATLPLEPPPTSEPPRTGEASPIVLQVALPRSALRKVEDLPWSEAHAYAVPAGERFIVPLHVYNFGDEPVSGGLRVERHPPAWTVSVSSAPSSLRPGDRIWTEARLQITKDTGVTDGWVVLRHHSGSAARSVVAFRVLATPAP